MGTLWIDFRSAALDRKNQTIDPPTGFLQYSSDYKRSYDTATQLSQLGIHHVNAERFIQFVQREIITSREIFINNIGNLAVSEDGRKTLLADRPEAFNKFHQLPVMEAIPVKRFDKSMGSKELAKENTIRSGSAFKHILTGIIILLTFLLVYRLADQFNDTKPHHQKETLPVADTTDKNTDTAGVDSANQQEGSESPSPHSENYSPQDDSCIYVVGSFTVKNNALQMKNVLEKNGFQVYTSNFGKFERVGIKMICVQDTSDDSWKELKEKYPDLWVLDTQI